jgi:predicted RNA methylase
VHSSLEDILCDIGCGDGRFVITSFFEFGVRAAYGVELNHELAILAKSKLQRAVDLFGISKASEGRSLAIIEGNFFELSDADLQKIELATVYVVYLLKEKMHFLESIFRKALARGGKVISIYFPFLNWKPVYVSDDDMTLIYTVDSIPAPES